MSRTIRREACSYCKSKDNVCFFLSKNGIEISKCMTDGCEYNQQRVFNRETLVTEYQEPKPLLVGEYRDYRGISKEICELYGMEIVQQNGKEIPTATCRDLEGNPCSQKLRMPDKQFPWNNYQEKLMLFGLHTTNPEESNCIVITEGYEDAMSCKMSGIPACSINLGAGKDKTNKELSNNLNYLLEFEKIILWFDNDDAAKLSIKDALTVLPLGKVYVIEETYGYKDANEVLLNDETPVETIQLIVDNAKEIVPDGIIFGCQLNKNELLEVSPSGLTLPFPRLDSMIHGLNKGCLHLLGAGSSIGKSHFLRQLVYYLRVTYPDLKIANLFLEESQKVAPLAYLANYFELPLGEFVRNPLAFIYEEEYNKAYELLINTDKLMFTDKAYELGSRELINTLEYLAIKKYDIVILDHISLIISGTAASKHGERRDIDELMHALRALIDRTGLIVFAACHLSNPTFGKDWEEGREVKQCDFRGSGSLRHIPDVMIGLERDMRNPFNKDKTICRVIKNRWFAETGEADSMYYMEKTGKYFIPSKEFK